MVVLVIAGITMAIAMMLAIASGPLDTLLLMAGKSAASLVIMLVSLGIDVSGRTPHRLDDADMRWADLVVTMGCGDECPYIPGKRYVDWELDDPAGRPVEEVRDTRDEIAGRVRELVAELDGAPPTTAGHS